MIRYHGSPCWPTEAAVGLYSRRHACVSFAGPEQLPLVAEVCQSFILDNGAYSAWTKGKELDFDGFTSWVKEWMLHPGFDWCLIPDSIDGGMDENRRLIAKFGEAMKGTDFRYFDMAVPVWHMHEPLEYLKYLSVAYPRVALGSSGQFATVGSEEWWQRMHEAMDVVCDSDGRPRVKLHGLRMLNPTVFSHVPLASADSTNVVRSIAHDKAWVGPYQPVTKMQRALVLAERIESHVCAVRWSRPAYGTQMNMELIG